MQPSLTQENSTTLVVYIGNIARFEQEISKGSWEPVVGDTMEDHIIQLIGTFRKPHGSCMRGQ